MIDAKRLRLGNIFWEDYGGYKVVTAIGRNAKGEMPNTVSARALNNTVSGQFSCEHIYGVELTGELLIKCGFKMQEENKGYEYWYPNEDAMWSIRQEGNGKWQFCIRVREDEIWKFEPIIEYLHQLQNLYYALTQKEFEVNL